MYGWTLTAAASPCEHRAPTHVSFPLSRVSLPPLLGVTAPLGHMTWTGSETILSAVCAIRRASGAKYQSFNN